VQGKPKDGWRDRYEAVGTEEVIPEDAASKSAAMNVYQPGDTAGA
jgi:hypothetical protein